MSGGIAFSPLLPWPFLLAAGIIGFVLIAAVAWKRGRGWLPRGLTIVTLLAALANPRLVSEEREPRPDVAVVVTDRSLSQSIGERAAEAKAAEAAVRAALADLRDLDVRFVTAGGPAEDKTRMFSAVEEGLADIPRERLAGVVVITDGQLHDAPGPQLLPAGVPLHGLLTGEPGERDRRLRIDEAPAYGIVGGTVNLTYSVVDQAAPAEGGQPTRVKVAFRINGEPAGEREVAVGERQAFSVRLDRAGPTAIEAVVDAASGEISTLNNQAAVTVNGVRDKLRVLLVSGQPHPGERAWRNLLKSDAAVDLVHFTILRPPEKEELTPLRELSLIVFPVQELFERRLYDFDLVVFDRFVARSVLAPEYLTRVADYLRRGGAVLVAAGPEFAGPQSLFYTTLGEAMAAVPTGAIVEQAFRPRVSELGQRHPITSGLPGERVSGDAEPDKAASGPTWGRWFRLIETEVRRGSVLLEGPEGRALLVVDQVGEGRLAQLASDQIWLWGRGFDGGGPQGELSRRLVHWLMKEPELEEERLSAKLRRRPAGHRAADAGDRADHRDGDEPDGAQQTVVLEPGADGVARAEVEAGEAGLYRIEDPAQATWTAAGAVDPPELADLRATADVLAPVAEATGGGAAWLRDGLPRFRQVEPGQIAAGRGWMGLRRNNAYTVTGVREVPLLPALLVLAAVLAPLAAAWWREGR